MVYFQKKRIVSKEMQHAKRESRLYYEELKDLLMMEEERGTFPKNSGSVADLLEEMETAVARVEAQREKEAGQQQEPELQRRESKGPEPEEPDLQNESHRNQNRRSRIHKDESHRSQNRRRRIHKDKSRRDQNRNRSCKEASRRTQNRRRKHRNRQGCGK